MRNKLSYCLIAITLLLANYSCQKQQNESHDTKPIDYVSGIKKFISKYGNKGMLTMEDKQRVKNLLNNPNEDVETPAEIQTLGEFASASLDVGTTHYTESNINDINNDVYNIYETSFTPESGLVGSLISIVKPNNRILSYMSVFDFATPNEVRLRFFYVNGDEIGTAILTDGNFETTISTTTPTSPATNSVRGWWNCTNTCIKTAVSACNNDPHCNSVAANVNGAWKVFNMYKQASRGNAQISPPPTGADGGLVQALIAASCGIHCMVADDTELPILNPNDIDGSILGGGSTGGSTGGGGTGGGSTGGGSTNNYPLADLWSYINVVKSWCSNHETIGLPESWTSGELIYVINQFVAEAPSGYELPANALESDFIIQVKNFVNSSYFTMPGASDSLPTPYPGE